MSAGVDSRSVWKPYDGGEIISGFTAPFRCNTLLRILDG